jgi:hypothetical protein
MYGKWTLCVYDTEQPTKAGEYFKWLKTHTHQFMNLAIDDMETDLKSRSKHQKNGKT